LNLVRLLGYCQDEEQVLIYEFAEEGSIWDHLHGQNHNLVQRNWALEVDFLYLEQQRERESGESGD
jgi:hypothetical protein